MALAGNTTGAGGAKSLAKVERDRRRHRAPPPPKPRPAPPPSFPHFVPQRPGETPAQRATSVRKRAKRVELSAQRKQIGYDKPILVKRRERVERQAKAQAKREAPGRYYASLGKATEAGAAEQQAKALKGKTVKIGKKGGTKFTVPAALLAPSPAAAARLGFKAAGTGEAIAQAPVRALLNAPKDVEELAVSTPSSLAHLAATSVKGSVKAVKERSFEPFVKAQAETAKMVAKPFQETIKHPIKSISEHPVSTYLEFAGGPRALDLGAGRVARRAGLQTRARPSATLEGTTLTQAREGSRSLTARALQGRADKRAGRTTGPRRMDEGEVKRRVDEHFDAARQQAERARQAAQRTAREKGLKGAERDEHISGVMGGTKKNTARKRFVEEFGSHWQVHKPEGEVAKGKPKVNKENVLGAEPGGVKGTVAEYGEAKLERRGEAGQKAAGQEGLPGDIAVKKAKGDDVRRIVIKPKGATKGYRHDSKADAQFIADQVPFPARVVKAGKSTYGVVPEIAAKRLSHHQKVGTSPALGSKLMRAGSQTFRGTVLPTSSKWLFGQAVEAAVRAGVAGAGPLSYARMRKVVNELERQQKGLGKEFQARVTGGHYGTTSLIRERGSAPTYGAEFADTPLAGAGAAATRIGKTLPARGVKKGWGLYTKAVFDVINRGIEHTAQTAMAGKAIKQSSLMEGRTVATLTEKAIKEAADGLKGTEAQVELGRQVDRAYGRYSKFSPTMREWTAHWTPFLPWYLNVARFLGDVLPRDHPIKTSLATAYVDADREWRMRHHLSLYGKDRVPAFMMGTYPLKGDRYRPVGRYLPAQPASPTETAAGLFLPQFSGVQQALTGVDWKGKPIRGNEGTRALAAAQVGAETHIPLFSLGERLANVPKAGQPKSKVQKAQKTSLGRRAAKAFNPVEPIQSHPPQGATSGVGTKVKPVKVKPITVKPVKVK